MRTFKRPNQSRRSHMKSIPFWSALLMLLCICGGNSRGVRAEQKKELAPETKVDRVTVYHDRALVTRVARCADLEPGIYEIRFNNMPSMLMDESVRARTIGADVKILDVEVRALHLEQSPEKLVDEQQKILLRLEDEKRSIASSLAILKDSNDYLRGVRESFLGIPAGGGKTGTAGPGARYRERTSIAEYEKMLTFLKTKQHENAVALQQEEKNLRSVEKKIALAREKFSKMHGAQDGLPRKKFIKVTAEVQRRGSFDI